MKLLPIRSAFTLTCLALAGVPAPAYYHFLHYLPSGNAPEKFDLAALPNKTVAFFVSEDGPALYARNDTFNSVLSQIRQAADVWNAVPTSDLRVAFGGFENAATPQNRPGGDVIFEDLPPGVYGYGGPVTTLDPVSKTTGDFIPISRSVVHLNRNVNLKPGPSYAESFFLTVVHEMGHSLGLQHTFTSAAMSTATTRATSLSRPIDADDMAGLSVLYPAPGLSALGSISGRITDAAGNGVHLASVVAIRAGGAAVSALTLPDGTYEIDGVPPAAYSVYVHSLPPDADIRGPWDVTGKPVPPSGATETLFYPGTTNFVDAAPIAVKAATIASGIDIAVRTRPNLPVYDVSVYTFFDQNAIKPAVVNLQNGNSTVVASGAGLGSNGKAPGLGVQVMGGSVHVAQDGVRPYSSGGYTYVALDLISSLGASPGPQHVLFTTPDYLYVLPSGIVLTRSAPPSITSVSGNADGTAIVTGANWARDTKIYFDGLPAAIRQMDATAGRATVVPPSGADGQTSNVIVYNSDGQNSQFLQSGGPVTYQYAATGTSSISSVTPASLPAGSEAVVELQAIGTTFQSGVTTIGFGSSDILVRRVFVLSPTHLLADISIGARAAVAATDVSVFTGFQMATATAAFRITASAGPLKPSVIPSLINAVPLLSGAYPGATVSLYGANMVSGTPLLTLNERPVPLLYTSPGQFNLTLPLDLTPGPAILRLFNGADTAYPVAVDIDPPPAVIAAIQNSSGVYVDGSHPVRAGDQIIATLRGVSRVVTRDRVRVSIGGVDHQASTVEAVPGGFIQVSLLLNDKDPVGASVPFVVYIDGLSSLPVTLPVAASGT